MGGGGSEYVKLLYVLAEYRIHNTETHVHKITNVPVFYMVLVLKDSDAGPNGPRFARCHFRAQKSLDFQGSPLSMALEMDVARIKIITSRAI
jgi:hypothetical protein